MAVAVFCIAVGSTALAAAAGGEKAPNASVEKQLKKLKKKVKNLKDQVEEVSKQPGPAGPQGQPGATGATGATGEQGPPGSATGSAGGDLTGNYPNPTIAPGAIGQDTPTATDCVANGNCSAKIASSSIGFTEIAANQVRSSEIANASVKASELGTVVDRTELGNVGNGEEAVVTATCEPGEVLLGGGGDVPAGVGVTALAASRPNAGGTGWTVVAWNASGSGLPFISFARCLQA